ncbi:MAG: L-aspartate oxidase, partial [Acidovorax sp.]|nr:L-aspartate oxidase [Acidovorax sp.]
EAIAWLRQLGVPFSMEGDQLHLTREGGHSARRIAHVTDATGAAVQRTLIDVVRATKGITVFEQHTLVDVITSHKLGLAGPQQCLGLYALDGATDEVVTFRAPQTILATGGAGKVYLYTTNPDTATGDGIAAAWRAGCRVGNMEFIQFHPTGLYHPHAKSFLISEAVRGEGGKLLLPASAGGTRFMPQHDERAELAPRDVVARAIDYEMKRHGLDCVHLDISHQSPEFLHEHFPNILAHCASLGIDITKEPIPVVPTAHFTCGGVLTDLAGRTDLPGLYAVGEVACTGLHGANRLASNSLLECMVFARAAAHAIAATPCTPVPELPGWDDSRVQDADESVVISHNWDELRRFMWDYVGIVRTNKRLERAAHRIALLQAEIQEFYAHFHITRDLLELRNLVQVADLIIKSAQMRRESRGLHYSRDYPALAAPAAPTILVPPVARH